MLAPPFKLVDGGGTPRVAPCCDEAAAADVPPPSTSRLRLVDLDGHLHCSIVGTCLTTVELRKLMERHAGLRDAGDVEVHHEAVRMIPERGAVAKAVQKALDRRHAFALRQASRLHGAAELAAHWQHALRQGEVPGAYWAVMTHRDTDAELVREVFGDVHMLSHLVGAANRADIRRLVALQKQNDELNEAVDALRLELGDAKDRRERTAARNRDLLAAASLAATARPATGSDVYALAEAARSAAAEVALQKARCDRWEQAAIAAAAESARLRDERDALVGRLEALEVELGAVEAHVADACADTATNPSAVARVQGRRILYVGGRPGTTTAIRDLVTRHGGSFRSHDGGLEDRKGLLAPAVASSDVVVFPVDCIDHDSAGNIKRLCTRNQVPYIPLRSAGIASFVAGLAEVPPR